MGSSNPALVHRCGHRCPPDLDSFGVRITAGSYYATVKREEEEKVVEFVALMFESDFVCFE